MPSPPPSPLARPSRTASVASSSTTSSIPLTADGSVVALGSSPRWQDSAIPTAAAAVAPPPLRSLTSSSLGGNSIGSPLDYYFSTALPSVGSPGAFERRGSSGEEAPGGSSSLPQPQPSLPAPSHPTAAASSASPSLSQLSSSAATSSSASSSSFYALSRSQPESALVGGPRPRLDAAANASSSNRTSGPLSAVSSGSEYSFGNLELGTGSGSGLVESPPAIEAFGTAAVDDDGDGDTTIGRTRGGGQARAAMPWQLPPVTSGSGDAGDMEALLDAEIDRYSRPDSGSAAAAPGLPRSTRTSRLSLLDLDPNVDRASSAPVDPNSAMRICIDKENEIQRERAALEVTPKAQQEAFGSGAADAAETPRRLPTRQQQQSEQEVRVGGPPVIAPIRTSSPLQAPMTRAKADSLLSSSESLPESSGHSSLDIPAIPGPPFEIPPRAGSFASRSSWSADAAPTPSPAMSSSQAFQTNPYRASVASRASMTSIRTPSTPTGTGANRPWPTAMLYSHVKSIRSAGGRATAYARAINELAAADSGLASWCHASRQREAPQPRQVDRRARASGLRNLGLGPPASPSMRNVSGASEIAFPTRADAGQAVEIASFTIDPADPPDALPSNLPFPALAEQQQYLHNLGAGNAGGMRQSPSSQSIKSVGKGLAGFWRPTRRSSGRKESFPPPISSPIVPQVARITDNPAVRRSFDGGVPKRQTSIPSPSGPRERRSAANM